MPSLNPLTLTQLCVQSLKHPYLEDGRNVFRRLLIGGPPGRVLLLGGHGQVCVRGHSVRGEECRDGLVRVLGLGRGRPCAEAASAVLGEEERGHALYVDKQGHHNQPPRPKRQAHAAKAHSNVAALVSHARQGRSRPRRGKARYQNMEARIYGSWDNQDS